MHPVEQTIWLIESRLDQSPTLDDIARDTGLSRYYISRLFAEETGMTFSAYVRGRRLSEAARALLAGAPNIMDVALAAGYGSHEAFTRAFRAELGVTPEEVRARGQSQPIALRPPLRMRAREAREVAPPAVTTTHAARYVGLPRRYQVTELGGIPRQWEEFQRHLAHLDRASAPPALGIVRNVAPGGEDVEYTCALPMGCGLRARDGLEELELPSMHVAQFTHTGHISGIHASTCAVFERALPQAGLRPTGEVELIEVYGPEFDPRTGFGPVGLWVQVAR